MTDRVNSFSNGVSTASEYTINRVSLYTKGSEQPIDIRMMVNYIEIFESIYSPFLTVNINITDAQSINHVLPIIGEEFIELDVRGPDGKTGILGEAFYVHKLSERIPVGDKAYTYTLHCISPSAIIDMNLKLSKSMVGTAASLVENDLCKTSLSIKKPMVVHPTKNTLSYISNYWSPLKNISFICDRAISDDTSSASYVFYETKKSVNFVPIDGLVAQPSSWSFYATINAHVTTDPRSANIEEQQTIIHNLYVDEAFNYIDRIMSGAYGNRTLNVDISKKSYNYAYYDFIDSFEGHNRLNQLPYASADTVRRINAVFRHRETASSSIPNMPDDATDMWFTQRLTELASITAGKISFDASGRFNIYAGNVVDVVIPTSIIPKDSNINSMIDRTLSGRYLVTGLKHMLSRERHTISIEAMKDSLLKVQK